MNEPSNKVSEQPQREWAGPVGDELDRRREAIRRIDELREHLFARYGGMADSTDLIREDRVR